MAECVKLEGCPPFEKKLRLLLFQETRFFMAQPVSLDQLFHLAAQHVDYVRIAGD